MRFHIHDAFSARAPGANGRWRIWINESHGMPEWHTFVSAEEWDSVSRVREQEEKLPIFMVCNFSIKKDWSARERVCKMGIMPKASTARHAAVLAIDSVATAPHNLSPFSSVHKLKCVPLHTHAASRFAVNRKVAFIHPKICWKIQTNERKLNRQRLQ